MAVVNHNEVVYTSWKEDRDIILEYNQVDLSDVSVSNILGMGVDNVTRNQAVVWIMKMIENGGVHNVIHLNPYKLSRMKTNKDLRLIYNKATLHIADGGGLEWGARMCGFPLKERIPILSLIMDLIRIAEMKDYTIFFVGAKPEIAEKAFSNIKKSFPKVRIVGRHGGYFNEEREQSVVEAMRKSEPNLVFVGLGFPKEEIWIDKIKGEFKNTVFVSVGGCIDIIAGFSHKAPAYFIERGLGWFYRIFTRPWRIGRMLRLEVFYIKLICKKIFRKK